jgi:hypothetical protein
MSTRHSGFALNDDDTVGAAAPVFVGVSPYDQQEVLYGTEPGNSNAIAITDINQGQIGDCYLCAAMMEEVRKGPSFISNMIRPGAEGPGGEGTETVRLYADSATGLAPTYGTTHFTPVNEVVSNLSLQAGLIDGQINQDVISAAPPYLNGTTYKEIWPQVVEEAYAQLAGGVANIANGGNSAYVDEALSGKIGSIIQPQGFNLSMLQKLINNNDTIVFDTYPDAFGPLTNGLVGDHAYAYLSCHANGANTTLTLGNPWGFDNPTPVSLKSVMQDFSAIEIGHA